MEIRPAKVDDIPAIREVSLAAGQPPTDSGAAPAYVELLMASGEVLGAFDSSQLLGWGATRPVLGASMLSDLFIDPRRQGNGVGSALLRALWPRRSGPRFTFSSQDPRALPVYARTGLQASWPLLYMSGDAARLPSGSLTVGDVAPADASAIERSLTGWTRDADYAYWSGFPSAATIVIKSGDRAVAAGVLGDGSLTHLAVGDPAAAEDVLLTALHSVDDPHVTVCVSGMHPALATLLEAGFRIDDYDIHMCTPDVTLPVGWAYSPGLV